MWTHLLRKLNGHFWMVHVSIVSTQNEISPISNKTSYLLQRLILFKHSCVLCCIQDFTTAYRTHCESLEQLKCLELYTWPSHNAYSKEMWHYYDQWNKNIKLILSSSPIQTISLQITIHVIHAEKNWCVQRLGAILSHLDLASEICCPVMQLLQNSSDFQ